MKFAAVFALALAGLTSAALSPADIPRCAVTCIDDKTVEVSPCAKGDLKCVCKPENFPVVREAALPCVLNACGIEVTNAQVVPITVQLCAQTNASQ